MKKLLFLVLTLLSLKALAQEPYYDFKKFREDKYGHQIIPMDKNTSIDSLKTLFGRIEKAHELRTMGRLIHTQTNGTKIYALPTDNMTCIVPDMTQYNYNMPNAAQGKKSTGMPPGSVPHNKVIPEEQ